MWTCLEQPPVWKERFFLKSKVVIPDGFYCISTLAIHNRSSRWCQLPLSPNFPTPKSNSNANSIFKSFHLPSPFMTFWLYFYLILWCWKFTKVFQEISVLYIFDFCMRWDCFIEYRNCLLWWHVNKYTMLNLFVII